MSIEIAFLQDIQSLKKEYKEDKESFCKRYKKAESFVGSTKSIEYVKKRLKKYEKC